MRYYAILSGAADPIAVDVERSERNWSVTIAGRTHEVDAATLPNGALSLFIGDASYTVEFDGEGHAISALVKNQEIRLELVDARSWRESQNRQPALSGRQVVSAPMGGKVVRVLVEVGSTVVVGQGLMVIEAMKMENELKSPKTGKVVELNAREGSAVENNALLVVIE